MIAKVPANAPVKSARKVPKKSAKPKSFVCQKPFAKVVQFKVTLKQTKPPVWRRIQVPGCYSFWDLHCAITDAFGWLDYHLHQFKLLDPKTNEKVKIGIPDDDGWDEMFGTETLPDWKQKISRFFTKDNAEADYEYDFGDGWHHAVILEAIMPKEADVVYPRCIAGEKACPPEDCGGVWGYERFKKAIQFHNAKDHDEQLAWAGGWFDPDWFDLSLIQFGDPDARWRICYQDAPTPKSLRQVQYHRMHPKAKR